MLPIAILVPTFCAAFFYVFAAYIMKIWGNAPVVLVMSAALIALAAAAWFEIIALRAGRLGNIFIVILAFEVVLTAVCAFLVLGEVYSRREIFGLLLIVTGIGVTSWQSDGEVSRHIAGRHAFTVDGKPDRQPGGSASEHHIGQEIAHARDDQ